MERVILHCDCNSFYASVETVLRPELSSVPMAVCGDPKSRHGIILAKNELARRCGVKTAETIRQAKEKCPALVLVEGHHQLYEEYSKRIFDFYNSFTDQVEPFGIDEAWLDVTASQRLFGSGEEIAQKIRQGVREKFGLTVSVGVSFNKVFAKLASDYKKPDAVTVFSPENWKECIFPLPVSALLFVGHSIEEKLSHLGVRTIGQLAGLNRAFLAETFGKAGETLYTYANGLESAPVAVFGVGEPVKSIGNSITFPRDLTGEEDVRVGLRALADKVSSRLRRHGVFAASVSIVIKDIHLKTITRQMKLPSPSHLSDDLFDAALALILHAWDMKKPIRMLGITANKLIFSETGAQQLSFFDAPGEIRRRKRLENREDAVDRIRKRYGKTSIRPGSLYRNDLGLD